MGTRMEECGLQRANIIAENAALGATEEEL
jgi:hypothetical protein